MTDCRQRFGEFLLDADNRQLSRGGEPVALNARYFDALLLLVREQGRLVPKQRFFDEVWAGSVVTDAALTQCIKEIRRALGDDAASPRFVRTVAGHGYCFIAAVAPEAPPPGIDAAPAPRRLPEDGASPAELAQRGQADGAVLAPWMGDILAAALGGAGAGLFGGLLYGTTLAFSPQAHGLGTLSVVLVLLALSMLVGVVGALGVGSGLVLARAAGAGAVGTAVAAALGGLSVGGVTKLLASDTFTLLVGHSPAAITGGLEGAAIGLAVALGWQMGRAAPRASVRRPIIMAAASTALAGGLLPLAGGSTMAGSLASVAAAFDRSRIDMAPLARLFGEPDFGLAAQMALGTVEGAVFGGCVVAGLLLRRRALGGDAR